MEELKEFNGLFIDITWGAGGSTSTLTQEIAKYGKTKLNIPVNMVLLFFIIIIYYLLLLLL
jgi:5,10-methylenetetrahydrofolate reductase